MNATAENLHIAPIATWEDVAATQQETTVEGRRMTTEFVIASFEETRHGETGRAEVVVDVTTQHFGKAEYVGRPDKVFIATLSYAKRTRFAGHTATSFGLYTQRSVTLLRRDAARFSAKALAEVHTEALERLAANYERYEELQAVFAEAQHNNVPAT